MWEDLFRISCGEPNKWQRKNTCYSDHVLPEDLCIGCVQSKLCKHCHKTISGYTKVSTNSEVHGMPFNVLVPDTCCIISLHRESAILLFLWVKVWKVALVKIEEMCPLRTEGVLGISASLAMLHSDHSIIQ